MIYSLQMNKKYFFELIHKQDDHGTDHVEVAVSALSDGCLMVVLSLARADNTVIVLLYVTVHWFCIQWQLKQAGSGFSIIDSKYISLYTSECVLFWAVVSEMSG